MTKVGDTVHQVKIEYVALGFDIILWISERGDRVDPVRVVTIVLLLVLVLDHNFNTLATYIHL